MKLETNIYFKVHQGANCTLPLFLSSSYFFLVYTIKAQKTLQCVSTISSTTEFLVPADSKEMLLHMLLTALQLTLMEVFA